MQKINALIGECENTQDYAKYKKFYDKAINEIMFGAGGRRAGLKEQCPQSCP